MKSSLLPVSPGTRSAGQRSTTPLTGTASRAANVPCGVSIFCGATPGGRSRNRGVLTWGNNTQRSAPRHRHDDDAGASSDRLRRMGGSRRRGLGARPVRPWPPRWLCMALTARHLPCRAPLSKETTQTPQRPAERRARAPAPPHTRPALRLETNATKTPGTPDRRASTQLAHRRFVRERRALATRARETRAGHSCVRDARRPFVREKRRGVHVSKRPHTRKARTLTRFRVRALCSLCGQPRRRPPRDWRRCCLRSVAADGAMSSSSVARSGDWKITVNGFGGMIRSGSLRAGAGGAG